MADQGFTKYISDFAGAIKENGEDIMSTTIEIEGLFEDILNYLTDKDNLGKVKTGVQTGLDFLLESLETSEVFNIDNLKKQFSDITVDFEEGLKIKLDAPLDPGDILTSITSIIPQAAFPQELQKLYTTFNDFFTNIDISEIRIGAKKISEPVEEINTTISSTTNQNASTDQSSNSTSFGKEGTDPELETLFDDFFNAIADKVTNQQSIIEGIIDKLEKAIIESGFHNTLDEKKEEFMDTVTADGVTIPRIFEAASQLFLDLIDDVIEAISNIIEFLLDDLQVILKFIRDELFTQESGSVVKSIFEQFDIKDFTPRLISIPAFLMSVPFTIFTKAITGEKPSFANLSLDAEDDTNNKINGSLQICKTILPVIGLASYRLSRNYKKSAIGVEMIGDLSGLTFDILGQIYDNPDEEDEKQKVFWYLQWAKIGVDSLIMLFKAGENIHDLNKGKDTTSTLDHKVGKSAIIIPFIQGVFEALNFGYLIFLDNTDEGESDTRIRIGYYLDALPGYLDAIISLAKVPEDEQLERMEDSDKKLLTDVKQTMETVITEMKTILPISDEAYLSFYVDAGEGESDLLFLKIKMDAVRDDVDSIRNLLKNDFEEKTQVVELKETLNSIIEKLDQIKTKISETQPFIKKHEEEKNKITTLIDAFNTNLPIINLELEENIKTYSEGIGERITPTNEQHLRNLKDILNRDKSIMEGLKGSMNDIPIDIRKNKLLGYVFVSSNHELSILLRTTNIQTELESLIKSQIFKDNFQETEIAKLTALISSLNSTVNALETKKIGIQMTQLLSSFPQVHNPSRALNYSNKLYTITNDPRVRIEKLMAEISKGLASINNFEKGRVPKTDEKKIRKKIAYMDYGNILFNGVFQLTYGSLQINTGINP
ncbi:MAG: hypothetical protein AB8F94_10235 [Saprospiraceae bacterium]